MRRRRRLRSPAVAFSVLALVGISIASTPGMVFRGGLAGGGLYLLALQLVVSALAISAIDDSRDPQLVDPEPGSRWRAPRSAPGTATFRLRRALWHFHLRHFLPACLLAWGLSTSLSLIAIGVLDRGTAAGAERMFGSALPADRVRASELALGAVLLVTVLLTLRRRGGGRYGWVVGFSAGVVMAQVTFTVSSDDEGTATNWILFGAALVACLFFSTVADAVLRRRRRAQPA